MKLRLAAALLTASLVFASPARTEPESKPAEQAPPAHLRLAGAYVFAGGAKETDAKDAAIDKATEDMFFAIKGLARSKLREKTPVSASLGIVFGNGNVTVTGAALPSGTSPENGTPVAMKNSDGDPMKLSHRTTPDGKLVQSFVGENGSRTTTFVLSADGKTLVTYVSIDSGKLPKPVRYTLTYRRT
jgi:hypothetical protein